MVPAPVAALVNHEAGVERLVASYRSTAASAPVRLAQPTLNVFHTRIKPTQSGLDASGLTNVIWVDPDARTADVAGMCTYQDLVAETLRYGLTPLVTPPLQTVTLGAAVSSMAAGSASFRHGLPHESVLEMDILTGAGEVRTVSPNKNPDLYRMFPNSRGTLGYSTRLRIELEAAAPFVLLRHVRFPALSELIAAMDRIIDTGGFDGHPVNYLDGVMFSETESYLCIGMRTTTPGPVSDYTGQEIYYRSIQHESGSKDDRLTMHDYLWRWDTDWFWRSQRYGAQSPRIRRWWPRRYRRSSVYQNMAALDQRFGITDRIEKRHGLPRQEWLTQDVQVPAERVGEFLQWLLKTVPLTPIWLCPLRLRSQESWPLIPIRPDRTYVNIGLRSAIPADFRQGAARRLIERKASELDGHTSLHSESFSSREQFDEIYGGEAYRAVKKTYDPDARLLDLYTKTVQHQR